MKIYTIQVVIEEGNDEFWESLEGKTGCDEVVELVKDALDQFGLSGGYGTTVTLTSYTNKE